MQVLLEPFNYYSRMPGKGIRPKLIEAFNIWFQLPPEILSKIADITQKLHNASLMIDDIEDSSLLRRGTPVAHVVYGLPQTLNTANYVYFLAFDEIFKLGNEDASRAFLAEMINLHKGQGLDIYWRDNSVCPSEEEYIDMVKNKTGGLFRLSVGLMQAFSEDKRDFFPLVNELGLLYQVIDDYQNLQSSEYHANKSYCEDLTEGKFSFPIIHAIKSNPDDAALANIVKQKPTDNDVKRYACELMKAQGSFDYTKEFIVRSRDKVVKLIDDLGGNPALLVLVNAISDKVEELKTAKA